MIEALLTGIIIFMMQSSIRPNYPIDFDDN